MKKEELLQALEIIVDECLEGCAPVKLQIGDVSSSGSAVHGGLSLLVAPAIVLRELDYQGYSLSVHEGRAIVEKLG